MKATTGAQRSPERWNSFLAVILAHRSSPSRSFLLARTRRGLRGLHLDTSHPADKKRQLRGTDTTAQNEMRH